MGELLDNLKQLVELDRSFGIEFQGKPPPGTLPPLPVAPRPAASAPVASPPRPPPAQPRTPSALPASSGLPSADLAAIATAIAACRACGLCAQRTQPVPGEGSPTPAVVFVGEGPGAEEDACGRPFVGPAGQLLDKMITAMGLARGEVYLCNVVKCRPPGNRAPEPDELAACLPFLTAQLDALKPKVICLLGPTPLKALLGLSGLIRLHGQRQLWHGFPVIPTFHPDYLLRNAEAKKPAWDDLKAVLGVLGREPPKR
jgi:uracil-DNA glycosylase family 4